MSRLQPQDLKEKLLEGINADDPQLVSALGIPSLLPAIADVSVAEAIFSRLCAVRRSFSGVADAQEQIRRDIGRQLEDLFRALSPDIAVAGLLDCFARGYDLIEFITIVEVFSRTDSKASDFANQLREDLRQALRSYLKNGVKFAVSQEDFRGELKANLATALARFGEPEDITDLTQLARADIKRVRDARAALARGERSALAMGGSIVYAHFHVRAISSLDPDQAKGVLLSLLQEPEYEVEAAFGLARLVSRNIDGPFFHKEKDYCIIWEARAKQQPTGADQELRRLLSLTFKQKINTLLDERTVSEQPAAFDYRLVELIKVLASLDSHESAELVLHVTSLAGNLFLWRRVEAFENLLFNGADLPTEATLNVLNPIIEQVCERLYDTQGYELLVRCLCLLPFIDNPAVGVDRIHQILSDKDVPRYQLRRLIAALGCSRCHEAFTLLREFAVMDGDSPHYITEEWIKAVASLGGQEAIQILLSFIESGADGFHSEIDVDSYHGDLLASYIVDVANADPNLKEHVLSLCSIHLAPTQRTLLSKVISRLGTVEAILAGLDLIDDSNSDSTPYYLWRTLEDVFLERRPSGNSKSTYTLAPRGSNEIRERLFQLATTDNSRKRTAVSLLGQIEVWRLEHGRPNAEPRHPNFQSGKLWPLVL